MHVHPQRARARGARAAAPRAWRRRIHSTLRARVAVVVGRHPPRPRYVADPGPSRGPHSLAAE